MKRDTQWVMNPTCPNDLTIQWACQPVSSAKARAGYLKKKFTREYKEKQLDLRLRVKNPIVNNKKRSRKLVCWLYENRTGRHYAAGPCPRRVTFLYGYSS
jgi:hypothetical protein